MRMNKESAEVLNQLYIVEELTLQTIADRYGVRRKTIANWLKSYGMKTRDFHKFKATSDLRTVNGIVYKICICCKKEKPERLFKKIRSGDHILNTCLSCAKDRLILRRYGITRQRYNEIFESQGGKCDICGKKLLLTKDSHIDHKDNKVRGILCLLCNTGLGKFRDDITILYGAIEYLKKASN